MTPDMKRLCEAVKASTAPLDAIGIASPEGVELIYGRPEAIVRAVLTELREVSASMSEAGEGVLLNGYHHASDEDAEGNRVDYQILKDGTEGRVFRAMLDAILAEPTAPR